MFPLSWNLDHVGPLTIVQDAALLMQVISVYDPLTASIKMLAGDSLSLPDDIKAEISLGVGEYMKRQTEMLEAVPQMLQN
jgi:Asp-tRNA(Asn)/Glu-tRNA(Gln) amidotransferase A subunit family amidase